MGAPAAVRRPQFAKPCHMDQLSIYLIVRGGPPATAVGFGNRLAPSIGRHLTGKKGLWGPLRTMGAKGARCSQAAGRETTPR